MSRVTGLWIAGLVLCRFSGFPADTVPEKRLFVVQVQALKSPEKGKNERIGEKSEGKKEIPVTEFTLDAPAPREVSVESRAQQIGAMNGTPLLRPAPRDSSRASSRIGRTLDLLLPPGKSLLSKNPNARRDPLRILEE
jgi:hypothetical protein